MFLTLEECLDLLVIKVEISVEAGRKDLWFASILVMAIGHPDGSIFPHLDKFSPTSSSEESGSQHQNSEAYFQLSVF